MNLWGAPFDTVKLSPDFTYSCLLFTNRVNTPFLTANRSVWLGCTWITGKEPSGASIIRNVRYAPLVSSAVFNQVIFSPVSLFVIEFSMSVRILACLLGYY